MRQNRKYEFVVLFETIGKIFERHNRIFDFFAEKNFFQKKIKFGTIEVTNDENIDDIVRIFITKINDCFRNRDEIKRFSSFKKLFEWRQNIVCLQKHFRNFWINSRIFVEHIIFFLVFFVGFEKAKRFQIDEFAANSIDLFVQITAQFTDKKPVGRAGNDIFDDKFFQKLHA